MDDQDALEALKARLHSITTEEAEMRARSSSIYSHASEKATFRSSRFASDRDDTEAASRKTSRINLLPELERLKAQLPSLQNQLETERRHTAELESSNEALHSEITTLRAQLASTLGHNEGESTSLAYLGVISPVTQSMQNISMQRLESDITEKTQILSEYHNLLKSSVEELEATKAHVAHLVQTNTFLDNSLAEFDAENSAQYQEINQLKEFRNDAERKLLEKQRQIDRLEYVVKQLEASLELSRSAVGDTRAELTSLRKERSEQRAILEKLDKEGLELVKHSAYLERELAARNNELQALGDTFHDLKSSSEQKERVLHSRICDLEQELSSGKRRIAEEKQMIENELAIGQTRIEDQLHELSQAKRDLLEAQQAAIDAQNMLDLAALRLQNEIALVQGANVPAGLGVTELLDHLKESYLSQIQALKIQVVQANNKVDDEARKASDIKLELAQVNDQLEQRNQVLQNVLTHLQDQSQHNTQLEDRVAFLLANQAIRARMLKDAENDANALSADVSFWKARFQEAELEMTKLNTVITRLRSELKDRPLAMTDDPSARKSRDAATANFDDDADSGKQSLHTDHAVLHITIENLQRELQLVKSQLEESRKMYERAIKDATDDVHSRRRAGDSMFYIASLSLADELAQMSASNRRISASPRIVDDHVVHAPSRLESSSIRHDLPASSLAQVSSPTAPVAIPSATTVITTTFKPTTVSNLAVTPSITIIPEEKEIATESALVDAPILTTATTATVTTTAATTSTESDTELRAMYESARAEIRTLQDELIASDEEMRASARAGVSLSALVVRMRDNHAKEVGLLSAQLASLKTTIDELKSKPLLDSAHQGKSNETADVIETPLQQAQSKLNKALQRQQELEQLLLAHSAEAASVATIKVSKASINEMVKDFAQTSVSSTSSRPHMRHASTPVNAELSDVFEASDFDANGTPKLIEVISRLRNRNQTLETLQAQSEFTLGLRAKDIELLKEIGKHLREEIRAKDVEFDELLKKNASSITTIAALTAEVSSVQDKNWRLFTTQESLNKRLFEQQARIDQLNRTIELLYGKDGNMESLMNQVSFLQLQVSETQEQLRCAKAELIAMAEWARLRALRTWQHDDRVQACNGCQLEFTLTNRRHHCRVCGKIFCAACCQDRVLTTASGRPDRSCRDCLDFINLITYGYEGPDTMLLAAIRSPSRRDQFDEVIELTNRLKVLELHRNLETLEWGFHMTVQNKRTGISVVISSIVQAGIAQTAGISVGDEIVAINSIPLSRISLDEFLPYFRENTVKFTIKRPGFADAMADAVRMSSLATRASMESIAVNGDAAPVPVVP